MNHKRHFHLLSHILRKNSSLIECAVRKICIEQVPIFNQLNDREKTEISFLAVSKRFQKGEIIFSTNELSENLYIVHKGKVKISRLSISGKEQILQILEPGDFTGELSLFGQSIQKSTAEALKETDICLIRGKDIKKLVLKIPTIAIKILEEYTKKFDEAEDLIEQLGIQNVEQRIARYLLKIVGDKENNENGEIELALSISKQDLASFIGTTKETLSRKLTAFQEQGWIKLIGHRRILILDKESLRQIIYS
ncbi:MAG TPA: Crp/Fnr family transcriptional regulator [Bacillales bacterium]|nr:Crp/Fnr family transcriptional regulator [Bacillales bacterium]